MTSRITLLIENGRGKSFLVDPCEKESFLCRHHLMFLPRLPRLPRLPLNKIMIDVSACSVDSAALRPMLINNEVNAGSFLVIKIPLLAILFQDDINAGSFSILNKFQMKQEQLILPVIVATLSTLHMQNNYNAGSIFIARSNLRASPACSEQSVVEARASIDSNIL